MDLTSIKTKFRKGTITKASYIRRMHKIHEILFDYSKFITSTDISDIHITDDNVTMTTRDKNIILSVDPYDKRVIPLEILNFDHYEQECFDMMRKLIKPGSTIFDIGANIGWYTMNLSKSIHDSRVYAFEPIPQTFRTLKKNMKVNNVRNVKVFQYGLSNEEKITPFYYYREGLGNASSKQMTNRYPNRKVRCRVRKLDNIVKEQHIHINFMKCDVEGAELFVFQGAIETLKQDKPIIFVEMLRKWARKFGYHPNKVIELLKTIGYRSFTVQKSKLKEFFSMNATTAETNFFFLHKTLL